jgi:hypothetical protein
MSWTEVIIPVESSPDERLLLEAVAPLVGALRPRLAAWHFFWEPDLWLRLRWTDPSEKTDHETLVEERLNESRESGLLQEWRFGSYDGDAEMMGEEMWARCEADFTNGAEMALAVLAHEKDGTLTRNRGFHWARHVHTFSNPLVGTWAEEARLSLLQARYRIRILRHARIDEAVALRLAEIVEKLEGALASVDVVAEAEAQLLTKWREEGRPDIVTLLELPEDFHRDPGEE